MEEQKQIAKGVCVLMLIMHFGFMSLFVMFVMLVLSLVLLALLLRFLLLVMLVVSCSCLFLVVFSW